MPLNLSWFVNWEILRYFQIKSGICTDLKWMRSGVGWGIKV